MVFRCLSRKKQVSNEKVLGKNWNKYRTHLFIMRKKVFKIYGPRKKKVRDIVEVNTHNTYAGQNGRMVNSDHRTTNVPEWYIRGK